MALVVQREGTGDGGRGIGRVLKLFKCEFVAAVLATIELMFNLPYRPFPETDGESTFAGWAKWRSVPHEFRHSITFISELYNEILSVYLIVS